MEPPCGEGSLEAFLKSLLQEGLLLHMPAKGRLLCNLVKGVKKAAAFLKVFSVCIMRCCKGSHLM